MGKEEKMREAAKELVMVMNLTNTIIDKKTGKEEKVPVEIGEDMSYNEVEDFIQKAIPFIEPADKFSKETQKILDKLGVPETEEVKQPDDSLVAQINAAERLRDLKDIATEYDEFKELRGKVSSYKTIDALREVMLLNLLPPEDADIPVEETKATIDELIPEGPIEDEPVAEIVPETVIGEDHESYPEGSLMMQLKHIRIKEPFCSLFVINQKTLNAVIKSMEEKGFDEAFPLIMWDNVVIDGHTRLAAAEEVGLEEVPVYQKEFANEKQALQYAIHNQRDRRNITDAELLRCIAAIDAPMTKSEAGKKGGLSNMDFETAGEPSHKKTAAALGVGPSKISEARTVLSDEEAKKKVEKGERTISAAAKEVRKKRKIAKTGKKAEKESKTRIVCAVEILKNNAGYELNTATFAKAVNSMFIEAGGTDNINRARSAATIVVEVLTAYGWITRISDTEIKIAGE